MHSKQDKNITNKNFKQIIPERSQIQQCPECQWTTSPGVWCDQWNGWFDGQSTWTCAHRLLCWLLPLQTPPIPIQHKTNTKLISPHSQANVICTRLGTYYIASHHYYMAVIWTSNMNIKIKLFHNKLLVLRLIITIHCLVKANSACYSQWDGKQMPAKVQWYRIKQLGTGHKTVITLAILQASHFSHLQ